MQILRAALALTQKDLVSWFRTPVHVLVSFAPIVVIMVVLAFVMGSPETMPVAVVLDDPDDLMAQQFAGTVGDIGTANFAWFEVVTTDREEAEARFQKNELLGIIEVPAITSRLQSGESATVRLRIDNLNDDITKNFRQRVQEACLVFNDRLQVSSVAPVSPSIKANFDTFLPQDLPALVFFGAGLVALAILMGGINNACTLVAREFEENTYKELVLAPGTTAIILGKWASALVQTFISVGIVWGLAALVCNFIPSGNIFPLLLLVLVGGLAFAGLGTLLGLYFKQVIPAAIAGMLFSIVGWWFGGMIWADIWPPSMQGIIVAFPTTYLIRAFTKAALLNLYTTYWLDVGILLAFGLVTGVLSYVLLRRKIALL
jgi:ABC-type transport system involved in multi-copper enzyme maturation permease subunit